MNISLPDEMRSWIEDEVKGGGFSSASEYFRQLVREAKVRKAQEEQARKKAELAALLIEGVESGSAQPMTSAWWTDLLQDVDGELKKRGASEGLSASGALGAIDGVRSGKTA